MLKNECDFGVCLLCSCLDFNRLGCSCKFRFVGLGC